MALINNMDTPDVGLENYKATSDQRMQDLADIRQRKKKQAQQANTVRMMLQKEMDRFKGSKVNLDEYGNITGNAEFNNSMTPDIAPKEMFGRGTNQTSVPVEGKDAEATLKNAIKTQQDMAKNDPDIQNVRDLAEIGKKRQGFIHNSLDKQKEIQDKRIENYDKNQLTQEQKPDTVPETKSEVPMTEEEKMVESLSQSSTEVLTDPNRNLFDQIDGFVERQDELDKWAEIQNRKLLGDETVDQLLKDNPDLYKNSTEVGGVNNYNNEIKQQDTSTASPVNTKQSDKKELQTGQSQNYRTELEANINMPSVNVVQDVKTSLDTDPYVTDEIRFDANSLARTADLYDANMAFSDTYNPAENPYRKAYDKRLEFLKVYDESKTKKGVQDLYNAGARAINLGSTALRAKQEEGLTSEMKNTVNSSSSGNTQSPGGANEKIEKAGFDEGGGMKEYPITETGLWRGGPTTLRLHPDKFIAKNAIGTIDEMIKYGLANNGDIIIDKKGKKYVVGESLSGIDSGDFTITSKNQGDTNSIVYDGGTPRLRITDNDNMNNRQKYLKGQLYVNRGGVGSYQNADKPEDTEKNKPK